MCSLQGKILPPHVLLAVVLVGTLHLVREARWEVQVLVAAAVTRCWRWSLARGAGPVTRLRSLGPERPDISRGIWPARSPPNRVWGGTRSTS